MLLTPKGCQICSVEACAWASLVICFRVDCWLGQEFLLECRVDAHASLGDRWV